MRLLLGLVLILQAMLPVPASLAGPWSLPPLDYVHAPAPGCPYKGAPTVYRVCEDQMAVLASAMAKARAERKLLLVIFGAPWCPWCRTLHAMLPTDDLLTRQGEGLDYQATFHVVEIATSTMAGGRQTPVPSGEAVLAHLLARSGGAELRAIPFLTVMDPADATSVYARNLDVAQHRGSDSYRAERIRALLREAHGELRHGVPAPAESGWLMRRVSRWLGR